MDRPTSIENHFQVLHRKTQRHLTESARSWILYRGRDWIDTETEKFDLMCPVKWKSIYFVPRPLLLSNLRSSTVTVVWNISTTFSFMYTFIFDSIYPTICHSALQPSNFLDLQIAMWLELSNACVHFAWSLHVCCVPWDIRTGYRSKIYLYPWQTGTFRWSRGEVRNEQPYKICIELGPSRLRSSTCCYLKFTLDFVWSTPWRSADWASFL